MKKRMTGEEKLREKYSKRTFEQVLLELIEQGFEVKIYKGEDDGIQGVKFEITRNNLIKGIFIQDEAWDDAIVASLDYIPRAFRDAELRIAEQRKNRREDG